MDRVIQVSQGNEVLYVFILIDEYLAEMCDLQALENMLDCQDPSYEKKNDEKPIVGIIHQS